MLNLLKVVQNQRQWLLRYKCYYYTIPKDNLPKSPKFEFPNVFRFSCTSKKRSFCHNVTYMRLFIWRSLLTSSYFFCVSKVSSLLHHGLVGQNQNKKKNALVHSQVILLQVLLFFIITFIFYHDVRSKYGLLLMKRKCQLDCVIWSIWLFSIIYGNYD